MDSPPNESQASLTTPYIVEPSSQHTHTLILLHGLGSNGPKFGSGLLQTGISSNGKTLPDLLPGARFIFPTAKRRRSSAFHRAKLTQWFDIASLDDPSHRSHTQLQGLEESYGEILSILNREAEEVSPKNVILGGLSQGCAMALICLLAIDFPIGGFIGMSGWLPLRHDIEPLVKERAEDSPSDEGNPFGDSDDGEEADEPVDPVVKVVSYVRDSLDIGDESPPSREASAILTPVFLGHGAADEKIRPELGKRAFETLKSIGFQVDWTSYEGQGHWYKIPDEIDDIVGFIRTKVGWTIGE